MRILSCFFLLLFTSLSATPLTYEKHDNIHILTVNPDECLIAPVRAKGRETVLELANHYSATAGINGGFWKKDGTPQGILKIFHEWHGTPLKPRGAIGSNDKARDPQPICLLQWSRYPGFLQLTFGLPRLLSHRPEASTHKYDHISEHIMRM